MQAFRSPLDESAATDLRFHCVAVKMLAPIQWLELESARAETCCRTDQIKRFLDFASGLFEMTNGL